MSCSSQKTLDVGGDVTDYNPKEVQKELLRALMASRHVCVPQVRYDCAREQLELEQAWDCYIGLGTKFFSVPRHIQGSEHFLPDFLDHLDHAFESYTSTEPSGAQSSTGPDLLEDFSDAIRYVSFARKYLEDGQLLHQDCRLQDAEWQLGSKLWEVWDRLRYELSIAGTAVDELIAVQNLMLARGELVIQDSDIADMTQQCLEWAQQVATFTVGQKIDIMYETHPERNNIADWGLHVERHAIAARLDELALV